MNPDQEALEQAIADSGNSILDTIDQGAQQVLNNMHVPSHADIARKMASELKSVIDANPPLSQDGIEISYEPGLFDQLYEQNREKRKEKERELNEYASIHDVQDPDVQETLILAREAEKLDVKRETDEAIAKNKALREPPINQAQNEYKNSIPSSIFDKEQFRGLSKEETLEKANKQLQASLAAAALMANPSLFNQKATDIGYEQTYGELVADMAPFQYDPNNWSTLSPLAFFTMYANKYWRRKGEVEGDFAAERRYWKANNIQAEDSEKHLLSQLNTMLKKRMAAVKAIENAGKDSYQTLLNLVNGSLDMTPENLDKAGVYLDTAMTSKVWKIRNMFTTLKDVFINDAKYSTDRTVGLEWARDAILDAVTDKNGVLEEDSFELFCQAMTSLAEQQKGDDDFGGGHRFASRTIQIARNMADAWQSEDWEKLDKDKTKAANKELAIRKVAGFMRAMTQKSEEYTEKDGFWSKAYQRFLGMAPDTLMFFANPFAGALSTYISTKEEDTNANVYNGLDLESAKYRAIVSAASATAAEIAYYPISQTVGGSVTVLLNRLAKGTGRTGGIARSMVSTFNKPGIGALSKVAAIETLSGTMEESVAEPLTEVLLQKGGYALYDLLGVKYGDNPSWEELYTKLVEPMWSDPSMWLATVMTSGALTGLNMPKIKHSQAEMREWMRRNLASKSSLLSLGFTEEQAQTLLNTPEDQREALAKKFQQDNLQYDPEGLRDRINSRQGVGVILPPALQKKGAMLQFLGLDSSMDDKSKTTMAEAYNMEATNGTLPMVEQIADRDGEHYYRITETDKTTGQTTTRELSEDKADAYLSCRLMEIAGEQVRQNQATVYQNIAVNVQQLTGTSMGVALQEQGQNIGIETQDMNELPDGIGEEVRNQGMMTTSTINKAAQTIKNSKLAQVFKNIQTAWKTRLDIARKMGIDVSGAGTRAYNYRNSNLLSKDGRTIAGSTLMYSKGNATALEIMEDSVESLIKMHVSVRAQEIAEAAPAMTPDDALNEAWNQLADQVREFRKEILKRERNVRIPEIPDNFQPIHIIEAMSAIGRARAMTSTALPAWMQTVQALTNDALAITAEAVRIGNAAREVAKETGNNPLEALFKKMDIELGSVFSSARMDADIVTAVQNARAYVQAYIQGKNNNNTKPPAPPAPPATPPTTPTTPPPPTAPTTPPATPPASPALPTPPATITPPTVDEIRDQQEEDDLTDQQEATRTEEQQVVLTPATDEQVQQDSVESQAIASPAMQESQVKPSMKGVFANDNAVYNPAGKYWMGFVSVSKLTLSDEVRQVKSGAEGKKNGVINELTGEYQQDSAPIFVWKRKNGKLEVISGRHRFALAQRVGLDNIACYVYEESKTFNAKWARLLDYENNMRDDQADELTSATYVRETGYDDATLREKGLLRRNTKAKRGATIGRFAKEELWTQFKNGVISAKDAELICLATRDLSPSKVEAIQRQCCGMILEGKSWEYINGMIQFMAISQGEHAQSLLDFGIDFSESLDRMAKWVEAGVRQINEAINTIKAGSKLTGKQKAIADRLGITATTAEDMKTKIQALALMKEKLAHVATFPDLMNMAARWDGHSPIDMVGMALNQGVQEVQELEDEKNMSREEWELAQHRKNAEQDTLTGDLFSMSLTSSLSVTRQNQLAEMKRISEVFSAAEGHGFKSINAKPYLATDTAAVSQLVKGNVDKWISKQAVFTTSDGVPVRIVDRSGGEVSQRLADRRVAAIIGNLDKLLPRAVRLDSGASSQAQYLVCVNVTGFSAYQKEHNPGEDAVNKVYAIVGMEEDGDGGLIYDVANTPEVLVQEQAEPSPFPPGSSFAETREGVSIGQEYVNAAAYYRLFDRINSEIDDTIEKLNKAAQENGGRVYVRWSTEPIKDTDPDFYSKNWATGEYEAGVSVNNLPLEEVDEADMAYFRMMILGRLMEYSGGAVATYHEKPHPKIMNIFAGEEVGEGSDGEPVLRHLKYLGYVDFSKVNHWLNGAKHLLEYERNIDSALREVEGASRYREEILKKYGLEDKSDAELHEIERKYEEERDKYYEERDSYNVSRTLRNVDGKMVETVEKRVSYAAEYDYRTKVAPEETKMYEAIQRVFRGEEKTNKELESAIREEGTSENIRVGRYYQHLKTDLFYSNKTRGLVKSRFGDASFSLTSNNPLEQTPYNTYNERRKGNADGRQSHQSLNTSDNHAEGYRRADSQLADTTGVSQADGSGRGRRAGRNVGSDRGLSDLVGRASDRLSQTLALIARLVRPCSLKRAFSILQNVRTASKNGACVDLPYESEGALRFVISDGSGGATVTIKADGDICALGKEPSCQIKGVAHKLLITAIRHGGIKMDCYGRNLVNIYAKYGFKPVARVAYNAEYADEDMKAYVRDVRNGVAPDVYVLMHDGSTLRGILNNYDNKTYKQYTQEELNALPEMEYDEAMNYRDGLVQQQLEAAAAEGTSFSITIPDKLRTAEGREAEAKRLEDQRTSLPVPLSWNDWDKGIWKNAINVSDKNIYEETRELLNKQYADSFKDLRELDIEREAFRIASAKADKVIYTNRWRNIEASEEEYNKAKEEEGRLWEKAEKEATRRFQKDILAIKWDNLSTAEQFKIKQSYQENDPSSTWERIERSLRLDDYTRDIYREYVKNSKRAELINSLSDLDPVYYLNGEEIKEKSYKELSKEEKTAARKNLPTLKQYLRQTVDDELIKRRIIEQEQEEWSRRRRTWAGDVQTLVASEIEAHGFNIAYGQAAKTTNSRYIYVSLPGATDYVKVRLSDHVVPKDSIYYDPNPHIDIRYGEVSSMVKEVIKQLQEWDSSGSTSFSVSDAKKQGLFRDGVMVTDNAIIVEPGVSFSTIDNLLHASPADFRKFDLSYLNTGEGNQAFGWGLYLAESEGVNRDYWNKFAALMRANAPKQLKVGKLVINVKADSWSERTDDVKKLARHINPKLTESALNEIGMASYDSYWGRLHGGIESLFNALASPINSKESITARKERGLQRLRREVEYFQDGVNDARERYEREFQSYDAKQEEFRLRLRLLDEAREEFVRKNNPQSKTGKKMVEGKFKNKMVRWEERSNSYNFHPDSYNAVNVKKETQWLQNELRKEPGQDAKEALTESENKLAIAQLLLKHFEKRGSVQAITQEAPTPMNYKTSFNAEDEELLKWDEVEPRAEYIVRTIKEETGSNINKNAKTGRGLYHELMSVLSPAWKKESQSRFSSPEWKAIKRDAQKKASEWLYAHGVKGIKYLDGNSRRKGEGTYNYVVFNDKDIKITAYSNADHWTMEKNAWTPYNDDTAGFSLTTFEQWAETAMRRRPDEVEADNVLKRLDKWLQEYERVTHGKSSRDGSALFGSIIAILEATKTVLPPQYKLGRLDMLLKWAAVYAEMVNSGDIPMQRGVINTGTISQKFIQMLQNIKNQALSAQQANDLIADLGAQRLDVIMKKVVMACRSKLNDFIKDRCHDQIYSIYNKVLPQKTKKGARKQGKLDSASYNTIIYMIKAMEMDTQTVAKEIQSLQNEINDPNTDPNIINDLVNKVSILQTFGDWMSLDVDSAEKALEEFIQFVATGRTSWNAVLELRKAKNEYVKYDIRSRMKKSYSANTRLNESRREDKAQAASAGTYSIMNMAQVINAAERVLGSAFVHACSTKLNDAIQNIKIARVDKTNAFFAAAANATGLKGEYAITKWLNDFSKVNKKTGIFLRNVTRENHSVDRTVAEYWCDRQLFPDKTARDKERQIAQEREKRTGIKEFIPSEADIIEMQNALADKKSTSQTITIKRTIYGTPFELVASKDGVANAILLFEQEDYRHLIANEGIQLKNSLGQDISMDSADFDLEATLQPLYDYIGPDGRAFIYALRAEVGRNGKLMQQAYEERTGVPLIMKPNYWKGNFDTGVSSQQDTTEPGNNKTSSRGAPTPSFLIERVVKHYEPIKWDNTATSVYNISMEAQNNYIYIRPVTEQWHQLLFDRNFERQLTVEMGQTWMAALQDNLNILDNILDIEAKSFKWFRKVMNGFRSALAVSALGGNPFVLVKQISGVLNGLVGGKIPAKSLDSLGRQLATRQITILDYISGMANVHLGRGKISIADIRASKAWQSRKASEHDLVAKRLTLPEGKTVATWQGAMARASMRLIEMFDLAFNLPGMAALGDQVVRSLEKINAQQNLGMTQGEIKQTALDFIGNALGFAAQPQTKEEKSISAAKGGILSGTFLMFKSETLNKLGAWFSNCKAGHWGNATQAMFLFGFLNSLVAGLIAYVRYGDDDEERRRKKRERGEDIPLTKWEDPRFYFASLWRIATSEMSAMPFIGSLLTEIGNNIEGTRDAFKEDNDFITRYVDYVNAPKQLERLITGKKGRRNRYGERTEDLSWKDYVAATQGLTKTAANLVAGLHPGASWSELLLSAATLSNWVRAEADVQNHIEEQQKPSK